MTFLLGAVLGCHRLKAGDAVWAEWTPGLWYHGSIEAKCAKGFKIRFDDQDEKCNAPEAVVKDRIPAMEELKVGAELLALPEAGPCYRARVLSQRGARFLVRCYNGRELELPPEDLRRLK